MELFSVFMKLWFLMFNDNFLLHQLMTDVTGNPEEERRTEFYQAPWVPEAVGRYVYYRVRNYSLMHCLTMHMFDRYFIVRFQYILVLFCTPSTFLFQVQQRRQELEQVLGIRLT